ncbi:MAG: hypothetical protein V7647_1876 [Acidobacteriota bacterium]
MRTALAALAVAFLAAHLPLLPPTLEDIDSINFALGVKQFDVSRHQPHPPGYPVFIAMGKLSTALVRAAGVTAPETRGLALWSTVSGTALIGFMFVLFRALAEGDTGSSRGAPLPWDGRLLALWAVVIAAASPLFWFTSLRPLSDMTGLAAAIAAQALLVSVLTRRAGPPALVAGALIAGLAIGIRSQTFLLTLPLLVAALLVPRLGLRMRDRVLAVAAGATGVLAWAIPLIRASGGLAAYAAALGTQAGEDFSGVVMLWNVRTPRVAVDALVYTWLWPWGNRTVGTAVVAMAAVGALRLVWVRPRVLLLLLVGFVPYAIFHLLFHEVVTVRYAVPLVVPIAFLAAFALDWPARVALPIGAVALAGISLVPAVTASVRYAREGSPTFRAFTAIEGWHGATAGDRRVDAVGMHAVARRAAQWEGAALPGRLVDAPHGREWLALVAEWRAHPLSSVAFVADPRRTDLALIEPAARRLVAAYRWRFIEPPYIGGARPGDADLYRMSPPRWMLDQGWAVGAEVAGVTARDQLGPHRHPAVAWVHAGADEALLMIGGRHLGRSAEPGVHVRLRANGRPLAAFDVSPGFFFKVLPIAAGALSSAAGYVPLDVATESMEAGRITPVALEQFDVQPGGVPMVGVEQGWHEPEYNPITARAWRWMSERSTMWVRPLARDVTLTIEGESPLRYFDSAPVITLTAGGRQVGRFSPTADFRQTIVLPADALERADGRVTIESDKWFVPGAREASADQRHLALRIYSYSVK